MAIRRSEPLFYNGKHYQSRKEFCLAYELNYRVFTTSMRMGISVEDFMEEYYKKKGKIAPHLEGASITAEFVEKVEPNCSKEPNCSVTKFIGNQNTNKFAEIIRSPIELGKKLSELNLTKINLIDFENLAGDKQCLKDLLSDESCVNVFFYNATKYSNQFYMVDRESQSTNLQVITTTTANQLIDHMIVYYLGVLTSLSNITYNIVSKDSGYYSFIYELGMNNVNIIGYEKYFLNKQKRFELSLAKYICELRINTTKYFTFRELKNIFKGFRDFKYRFNDLLNSLIELNLVKKFDETEHSSEYYLINKDKAIIIINRMK